MVSKSGQFSKVEKVPIWESSKGANFLKNLFINILCLRIKDKMGPKKGAATAHAPHFYSEGDKVMAADANFTSGGHVYAAQIIRAHKVDIGVFKYLVHYNGWKRRYDVWMEPSQLALASDEAAVKKLAEQELANHASKAGKKPTAAAPVRDTPGADGEVAGGGAEIRSSDKTRVKRDHDELLEEDRMIKRNKAVLSASDLVEEKEEDVLAMAGMDIPIQLKKKLVNEWSLVSEKEPRRLLVLPRATSVKRIFSEYLEMRKSKDKDKDKDKDKEASDGNLKETEEFCESLMIYFDRALPVILLYRHEREQYSNAANYMESKKLMPSDVYGGEHLNRLFVRLAKMLTGVVTKQDEITSFHQQMQQFLKFFDKNSGKYFVAEDYKVCADAVAVEEFRQEKATDAAEGSNPTKAGSSASASASAGR